MGDIIQISTTTEKITEAEKIANLLIDSKLAACVQVNGPAITHYIWKGKKERSEEFILFITTKKELFPEIEKVIKEIHAYETPEILIIPIIGGSKEYLDWIEKETK
ncbi:divalent-cation tolerance protein CutA [Candidatus Dependentiae bacterium]|nr:divalent-cation tolerance protein CutA [Candidatus Dependentiae bacterium]